MEFSKLVEERRSIRAFKADTEVKRDHIEEMIKCAVEAPTWKNTETGRYYVVTSDDILAKVKSETLPDFNQNSAAKAPCLIVTTFEKNRAGFDREGNPDNELGNEWGAYDLGLQNQLLILKARELGYDTLIMGIRDGEKLRQLLNIPDSQEVVAVIAVGYRDIDPQKPVRKELERVATFY